MRKHSNICPDCGAWLDAGERCDCREEAQKASESLVRSLHELSKPDLLRLAAFANQLAGDRQKAAEQAAGL